jgi:hypothetical protein
MIFDYTTYEVDSSSTNDDECAILGHVDALEYFTANFDGEGHQLKLVPNETLPS